MNQFKYIHFPYISIAPSQSLPVGQAFVLIQTSAVTYSKTVLEEMMKYVVNIIQIYFSHPIWCVILCIDCVEGKEGHSCIVEYYE